MTMQLKPRRLVVRGETTKTSDPVVESHSVSLSERVQDSVLRTKNKMSSRSVTYEAASVTPPNILGKPDDGGNYISVSADHASFVEVLTKMECDGTNPLDVSTVLSQDITHQKFQNFDVDRCVKTGVQDQITTFRNFLQSDFGHNDPIIHCRLVVGYYNAGESRICSP
ncbi:hypothetical protein Tco_0509817 [Tanacetum coccineum]